MDSYLQRLRQELKDATAGAGAEAMTQAPAGKWSAEQILEHLLLTYKGTGRGLAKCLQQGAPLAGAPKLKDRVAVLLVVGFGYFPNGRKSPERAEPRGIGAAEVWQNVWNEIEKMDSGLNECEKRFGARTRILDHPFLGPLTAQEWRKFHWVHGRHHARQIRERIRKS